MSHPNDPSPPPPSKSPEPNRSEGDRARDGDTAEAHAQARGLLYGSLPRYVELYDRSPVGYLTLDRTGVIRELNLTAASLLGKERARLIGSPLGPLLAPESRLAFRAHLERCFHERGGKSSVELRIARRGGPP